MINNILFLPPLLFLSGIKKLTGWSFNEPLSLIVLCTGVWWVILVCMLLTIFWMFRLFWWARYL